MRRSAYKKRKSPHRRMEKYMRGNKSRLDFHFLFFFFLFLGINILLVPFSLAIRVRFISKKLRWPFRFLPRGCFLSLCQLGLGFEIYFAGIAYFMSLTEFSVPNRIPTVECNSNYWWISILRSILFI